MKTGVTCNLQDLRNSKYSSLYQELLEEYEAELDIEHQSALNNRPLDLKRKLILSNVCYVLQILSPVYSTIISCFSEVKHGQLKLALSTVHSPRCSQANFGLDVRSQLQCSNSKCNALSHEMCSENGAFRLRESKCVTQQYFLATDLSQFSGCLACHSYYLFGMVLQHNLRYDKKRSLMIYDKL